MRSIFLACAASLAIASCNSGSGPDSASAAETQVNPDDVDPAALRESVDDEDVRRFYEAVQWRPVWDRRLAEQLLETLKEAPRHALTKEMFLPAGGAADPAAREAALTKAAIGFANALAKGKTDPKQLHEIYTLPRPDIDVAPGLAQAIQSEKLGEWLASLPPQTAEYRALSEAFVRYGRQAEEEGRSEIPGGDPIRPGESDARIPQIAEALRTDGYLPQPEPEQERQDSSGYSPEMVQAVRRMQSDYGLEDDGIVGQETLQVLNTGARDRARQLAVNLERLRWLERDPPPTRIDVNTAAAFLDYWRDGQHRDRRRVVVGQPGWETPQLGSPIFQLVANPNWVVPESIAEEELADKSQGWLRQNDFTIKDGRFVQQPGPQSALGEVKFAMKNDHAIYLHDTPAKHLFQGAERHQSHGCVRVEGALDFARMIAAAEGVRPAFERAMASREERPVDLPSQIPVRLMYRTAYVDGGTIRFRPDSYGWDNAVAQALGREAREARRVRTHSRDIGP